MAVCGATVVRIRDLTVGGKTNHMDAKYPECFTENFTEILTHARTVCTRPFFLLPLLKGPGDEAKYYYAM